MWTISVIELVNDRKWKEDLIPMHLGTKKVFDYDYVVQVEKHLNYAKINFKEENTK